MSNYDPEKHPLLTDDQLARLRKRLVEFRGYADDLEPALGAFLIGRVYGWRVVRLMHSNATYTKYQRILEMTFREECPEVTKLSRKFRIYRWAQSVGDFWKIVRGQKTAPDRPSPAEVGELDT